MTSMIRQGYKFKNKNKILLNNVIRQKNNIFSPLMVLSRRERGSVTWESAIEQGANLVNSGNSNSICEENKNLYNKGTENLNENKKLNEKKNFNKTNNEKDNIISKDTQFNPLDPLGLVSREMTNLTENMCSLLGTSNKNLEAAARYYVQDNGKHIRPLIVLLISKALYGVKQRDANDMPFGSSIVNNSPRSSSFINSSISDLGVLRDWNPLSMLKRHERERNNELERSNGILPSQRRLAEITELIHSASLLHDDVIDKSDSRRGRPSINSYFGNKVAVLAGDFLLGRASISLSRLRNAEVIELMASVIANVVEGEFMQLHNAPQQFTSSNNSNNNSKNNNDFNDNNSSSILTHKFSVSEYNSPFKNNDLIGPAFEYYMHKTYLKTASLICKSCRSAAVLGNASQEYIEASYDFGRSLGLAFQLIDDILDYSGNEVTMGKPGGGADLRLGLATAPVLFAWAEYPEIGKMMARKFKGDGDVDRARELVYKTKSVEKSKEFANKFAEQAERALYVFPESEARKTLLDITETMLTREK